MPLDAPSASGSPSILDRDQDPVGNGFHFAAVNNPVHAPLHDFHQHHVLALQHLLRRQLWGILPVVLSSIKASTEPPSRRRGFITAAFPYGTFTSAVWLILHRVDQDGHSIDVSQGLVALPEVFEDASRLATCVSNSRFSRSQSYSDTLARDPVDETTKSFQSWLT